MGKTYEFHPLANRYALLLGEEFEQLCQTIKERGLDKPITLYEGKILDGRNRYRACLEVGYPPKFVKLPAGEDPEDFVFIQNDVRRHETPEALHQRRQERIERVAAKRLEGKSIRAIADDEQISPSQVQRDLEAASTVPGGTVEPEGGKVTGLDGRTRTATPSKPPTESPGAVEREPGCDDDVFDQKDAERDAKRKAAKGKPKEKAKDKTGKIIPDALRDVFGDTVLTDCISELAEVQTILKRCRERLKRKVQYFPFVLVKDAFDALDRAESGALEAKESIEPGIPHAVCRECNGACAECKTCRFKGHLPRWRYEELKQEATA